MKKQKKLTIMLLLLSYIEPVMAMEVVKCGGFNNVPYKIISFIGNIINTIKIIVPILLIIMGIVDMAKAVVSNDDKKMKESTKTFIKRTIYAVLVFFVIAIVQFVFKTLEKSMADKENDLLSCVSCIIGNDCLKEQYSTGSSSSNTGNSNDSSRNSSNKSSNSKNIKVTSVQIITKKTEIEQGKFFNIVAKVNPSNATNKKLVYTSSKTSVATVNQMGKVTAKKKGTTTITVQSASNTSKKKSFSLKVIDPLDAKRKEVVNYAKKFLGNPYVWAGTSLTNGTDCSGFTMSVYKKFGYVLPRTAESQSLSSFKTITPNASNLKPGDLLFYANQSGKVNHVAMYIGSSKVIHASNPSDGIKISPYNYRAPVRAKRIIK